MIKFVSKHYLNDLTTFQYTIDFFQVFIKNIEIIFSPSQKARNTPGLSIYKFNPILSIQITA